MKISMLLILLTFSCLVRAEEKTKAEGPCRKVMDACKAADFGKSGLKNKSLFKDCMTPILDGEAVSGVTVDPKVVAACKATKKH